MNEELFKLLKRELEDRSHYYHKGTEELIKILVLETRKSLETILKENSYFPYEPIELQTVLKEFFVEWNNEMEGILERLEEEKVNLDEDLDEDLLEEQYETIKEDMRFMESVFDFATDVENFQANDN
ncbi:hypothetical protein MKY15_20530 [Sporosarcina sp. FSL K6-1540]|uniref:hypothetical protein n=1 Tax=Sporosarcina sp. FSL K6-1540 TaxID=2921555 RepID=UPI00315B1D11